MSQSGTAKAGGKAQGPYGPNDPPPPPAHPAPIKTNRKRPRDASPPPPHSPPPARFKRPYKHLNSRQRKHRVIALTQKEAEVDKSQDRELVPSPGRKGRSPAREKRQSSRSGNRGQVSSRLDKGGGKQSQTRSSENPKRQSLRDARQITPDQIIDETYGRLSPGTWIDGRHHEPLYKSERQSLKRSDWPDEQLPSSHPARGAQAEKFQQFKEVGSGGEHGVLQSDYPQQSSQCIANVNFDQYSQRRSPVPQANPMKPGWIKDNPKRIVAPLPVAVPRQDLNIEDEVDWDDDAFDVPERVHTPGTSDVRRPKPRQAPYDDREQYPDTQSSSRRKPRGWDKEQSLWQGNNKMPNGPKFQPQHAVRAEQYPPKERFEGYPAGDVSHPGYASKLNNEDNHVSRAKRDAAYNQSAINFTIAVPDTVYDLREYDRYITDMQKNIPPHLAYAHGNVKVAPHLYATVKQHDLGLCFATFATTNMCEMGVKCAWRHHPLTQAEREWILISGREGGSVFLKRLPQFWANPEVPVPGANMHDKVRAR
jgi:hypothetical protein